MAKIFSKAKRNCQYLQDKCYQKREPMNTRKKGTVLNYSWWIIDLCAPPYYTPGMCSNPAVIELAIWGFHSHLVFCEFISLSFLMQQVQDGAGKSLISIILNQRFLCNDQLCILWKLSLLCILSISLMLNLQSIFIGLHTGKIHKAPHYLIKSMLNVIDEGATGNFRQQENLLWVRVMHAFTVCFHLLIYKIRITIFETIFLIKN